MRFSMATRSTRTIIGSVTALGILVASGCGSDDAPAQTSGPAATLEARDSEHLPSDWDKVVEAANKEGKVVVYTNFPQEQTVPLIEAFNKIYPGIKVETVTDSAASLPARYEQERKSTGTSPADLLLSALFEKMIQQNNDWFENINDLGDDFFPSLNDFSDMAVPESRQHSITEAAYIWQLAYNTDKVKPEDLPKTWEDVADPKWKDLGIMVDPKTSASYGGFYSLLLTSFGDSVLDGIVANNYATSQSTADIVQKVGAGAFSIGFPANASKTAPLKKAGAPVELLTLDPSPLGATTMAVPTSRPNPNAARVFGNFVLTAQAQELQCTYAVLGSLNKKVAGPCDDLKIPAEAIPLDTELATDKMNAVLDGLKIPR